MAKEVRHALGIQITIQTTPCGLARTEIRVLGDLRIDSISDKRLQAALSARFER